MSKFSARFASMLPKVRAGVESALGRFPWMLLCGAAGTVAAMIATGHDGDEVIGSRCLKVIMAAVLGMPLFFSLRMLRERVPGLRKWMIEIVGLPLLAAWVYSAGGSSYNWPGIIFIRWLLLTGFLHCFAAVSAYVRESAGFWQFNRRIFLRFCTATLFCGVLTGGLELALVSADKLFNLDLDHSYLNLFYVMVGCFHPLYFLAGVPRDFEALETDIEYPRGLKAFTQFVLAPLVAVYALILYAYAVKIIAARAWPHGWVAMPVLILAGVGILAALLLHPLQERPEEKWGGWFCRNFPRALGPLSLLLLLSVWQRIAAYGVTEERYLGMVAGGWILVYALIFVVRRNSGIRWVPASLGVIALLAAIGPWSAGNISKQSQLARLTRLLEAQGLMVNGEVRAPAKPLALDDTSYDDLNSTLQYLAGTHGPNTLRGMFGKLVGDRQWTDLTRYEASDNILKALNITQASSQPNSVTFQIANRNGNYDVEGFKTASFSTTIYDSGWTFGNQFGDIYFAIDHGVLEAASDVNAKPQAVPIDALLTSLPKDNATSVPTKEMTLDWALNGHTVRIYFQELDLPTDANSAGKIQSCSFVLLEK
jgi:hypothetical protein